MCVDGLLAHPTMFTFVTTQPVSATRTAPITTPRAMLAGLMVLIALPQKAGTSHRLAEFFGNARQARAQALRRKGGGRAPVSAVSAAGRPLPRSRRPVATRSACRLLYR